MTLNVTSLFEKNVAHPIHAQGKRKGRHFLYGNVWHSCHLSYEGVEALEVASIQKVIQDAVPLPDCIRHVGPAPGRVPELAECNVRGDALEETIPATFRFVVAAVE